MPAKWRPHLVCFLTGHGPYSLGLTEVTMSQECMGEQMFPRMTLQFRKSWSPFNFLISVNLCPIHNPLYFLDHNNVK